jgi:hypothetical protein
LVFSWIQLSITIGKSYLPSHLAKDNIKCKDNQKSAKIKRAFAKLHLSSGKEDKIRISLS